MSDKFFLVRFSLKLVALSSIFISGCAVEAAKNPTATKIQTENSQPAKGIQIDPNSPADSVRAFYKNLREKRFREAIFLTNLRPAIEGLTDTELADLQVDFEPLAKKVPEIIEINGEVVSGEKATVTAKLPNNETGAMELQQLNLRKENGVWVILMVDEKAESLVKKEGNKYFFALKIDTYHADVEAVIGQILKVQMVYASQNGDVYADLQTLTDKGFVSSDLQNPSATGYKYNILLSSDKKKFSVTAEPHVYGKTGKLSFLVEVTSKNVKPRLKSEDNQGKPVKG